MGSQTPVIGSILCMVDLSDATKAVIEWSARFAQLTGAELRLLHAIHLPSDQLHPTVEFERSGDLQTRKAESAAAIEQLMPPLGISWRLEIVPGDPAEVATEYCKNHPIDLIVAGSLGITRLKRLFTGTVVERMARMVACPMLVLRPNYHAPDAIRRIGVCCDLSPIHIPLIRWGGRIARGLSADLGLLHAMASAVNADMVEPTTAPYSQVQQQLQHRVEEALLDMAREAAGPGVAMHPHLATGSAQDELLDLVRKNKIDLVVVGVRHHSAIGKLMVGSTTEVLLRKAPCHVLTVPASMTAKGIIAGTDTACTPSLPTGVVWDQRYLEHRSDGEHAENYHRLEAIYTLLDHLQEEIPLLRVTPRAATEEELGWVHSAAYVRQIQATAKQDYTQLTPDTYACAASYPTAALAAGGIMAAIDAVTSGKAKNAFVLARPPGHHAEAGRAGGYCLFNNVAIGAQYARNRLKMGKVLIVDWDLHHGNGIQHLFESDPSVLYFSSHQYPLFPGTGHLLEVGRGRGEGYNINVPLRKGLGDGDIACLYKKLLEPVAHAYKPDLVLVSAGFDLHKKDPLGGMKLSPHGFSALTRILMEISALCCQGRLILALEGGYHRQALADSVKAVLEELCGQSHCNVERLASKANRRRVGPVIHRCTEVMKQYWPCLREPKASGHARKQNRGRHE